MVKHAWHSWRDSVFQRLLVLSIFVTCATGGWAQSFTLSVTQKTVTIHPGDKNIPITVTVSSSTYTGPINIALIGLPSGISLSPLTLTAGSSGTLNLSATVSADQEDFPSLSAGDANSHANAVTVVATAGLVQKTVPITLTVSLSNPAYAPTPGQIDLPILTIDTGGFPIESKIDDVPGTVTITSADGQASYLPNSSDSDNTATFHVHGNSTALMPKLAYEMKLTTSLDLLNTMGVKCPYVTGSGKSTCDKSKTYILLANYDDKTFLRDWSASALANAIPIGNGYLNSSADSPSPSGTSALMPWAPHSLFVELYLNGVYEGNYQLIEKVNVDSHRINITELSDKDTTGDITGGYLAEIDAGNGEDFMFLTPKKVDIGLVDPDFTPEVPEQTSYISNYVDSAESALFAANFTDLTLGWRAYFDEASAVNFYIINDVMGNSDGGDFTGSDYLYKPVDNPLIYLGPVWDYDISSGNVNGLTIVNPTVPWMQVQAPWYVQWFKDPGFKADVIKQWNALKSNGVFTAWLASINQEAATLQQSQANNFGRWPMQGIKVWPNPEAAGSYSGEVAYTTNWIKLRMSYLDSLFNNKAQTNTALSIPSGTLRRGSPATLTAHVTGGTALTGSVYFLSSGSILGVAVLSASGTASLATTFPLITNNITNLSSTTENLAAVYSGDNQNALSASATSSVSVLAPFLSTTTALSSSVSSASSQTPASFSVVVIANSGTAVPTGTISFTSNGQTFGTVPLSSNGSAVLSPMQLPAGSDSIQAAYSGDSTYQSSSSNSVTVTTPTVDTPALSIPSGSYVAALTVNIADATAGATIYYTTDGTTPTTTSTQYAGAITVSSTETLKAIAVLSGYAYSSVATGAYTVRIPDFTLTTSTAALTFGSGPTSLNLAIAPVNGFNQQISFACSGLPSDDTCTFSPATVIPGGTPVTVSVKLSKAGVQAALGRGVPLWTKFAGGIALGFLIWPMRRRKVLLVFTLILLVAASFITTGCSSPRGFIMTITATGGSFSHSVNVIVN